MSDNENEQVEQTAETSAGEELENSKTAPVETLRILESLLFASDELLPASRLKAIIPGNPGAGEIGKMVERINRQLQKERHPFEIVEIGGGYQFKTVAYYHPWVRQIFQEKAAKRLSIQALECLSIIAYRQPLSKAEIETIRGVLSDGAMKTLLEKHLITITGRSERPGRPLLYGTTQDFLKYFGLNTIADLPKIEEFEALVRQKMENMPLEELKEVPAGAANEPLAEGETAEPVETAEAPQAAPEEPAAATEENNRQSVDVAENTATEPQFAVPEETAEIITAENDDIDAEVMEPVETSQQEAPACDFESKEEEDKIENEKKNDDDGEAVFEVKL
jgi:segregation and condensation protein B